MANLNFGSIIRLKDFSDIISNCKRYWHSKVELLVMQIKLNCTGACLTENQPLGRKCHSMAMMLIQHSGVQELSRILVFLMVLALICITKGLLLFSFPP